MQFRETVSDWFMQLQNKICKALEQADGKASFKEDNWKHQQGGGGRSRILEDGNVIEKGGVNFSAVTGKLPAMLYNELNLPATEQVSFFATGVSIVIHPKTPMVPIIHMNVRYFETTNNICWFGGGIDLTPHYIVDEDAHFFHTHLKSVCDQFDPVYYPKFKTWADDYFYIPHRSETRGIGGIFFDKLQADNTKPIQHYFDFVKAVGESFIPLYTHFIQKNKSLPFTAEQKQFQLLRRGRYVEFNLVYDRGTRFGLETNGRTESILMSLPKEANWLYNYIPDKGSAEEATLAKLKKGMDWIAQYPVH
jgi:coproporphyrinogen III oxidase